ncbi:MAG: hypothetical protein U0871_16995 [Gemmataceae bacterium]
MSAFLLLALAVGADPVEIAGLKATPPEGWKVKPLPGGSMRLMQFTVPKAAGDAVDAEVAVFALSASGTAEQNLKRQLDKFLDDNRKEVRATTKFGAIDATYQDVTGTFKKKPFQAAEKFTPVPDYRQLYVLFEKDGKQYYLWLLGPAKTVDKHKKGFEDWLKSFK